MNLVDAQVHITHEGFGGILAVMDAQGIRASILDEFWGYDAANRALPFAPLPNGVCRPLSPNAQNAALLQPSRFAWVQRVDRRDPELGPLMTLLASSPGCIGIRVDLRPEGELELFASGGWDDLLRLAVERALPVSVLSRRGAAALAAVAARIPNARLFIDHCGHAASEGEWQDILALGRFRNIWLKWAQAPLVFKDDAPPFATSQANLLRAVRSFGPERVVWASNASVTKRVANISQLIDLVRIAPGLSAGDQEWILGRAACELYQWNPESTVQS